jgi:HemY protein
MRRNLSIWAVDQRRQRGLNRTTQGLLAFVEGRWDFARKSLERSASTSATPLVNYLFAARASSAAGDAKAVDGFLKKAELSTEGAEVAIGLTQAELQLQNGQYEKSLATLLRVKKNTHNHPLVFSLLAKVYSELNDWQSVLKIMPQLRQGAMNPQELDKLEQYACKAMLSHASETGLAELKACWSSFPASATSRSVILSYYVEHLIKHEDSNEAESVLRRQLQSYYDTQLIEVYGRTKSKELDRQYKFAQKLLKSHASDNNLHIALARISHSMGLPEQAKIHYDESIEIKPSSEAYSELAAIYASQNNYKQSAALYAKGQEN